MRMIGIEFESLDLFIQYDRDDKSPSGIYAFAGRDKTGQYKYTSLDGVFTAEAQEEIYDKANAVLRDALVDEAEESAEEARYIRETCYDTPYARAA